MIMPWSYRDSNIALDKGCRFGHTDRVHGSGGHSGVLAADWRLTDRGLGGPGEVAENRGKTGGAGDGQLGEVVVQGGGVGAAHTTCQVLELQQTMLPWNTGINSVYFIFNITNNNKTENMPHNFLALWVHGCCLHLKIRVLLMH